MQDTTYRTLDMHNNRNTSSSKEMNITSWISTEAKNAFIIT